MISKHTIRVDTSNCSLEVRCERIGDLSELICEKKNITMGLCNKYTIEKH